MYIEDGPAKNYFAWSCQTNGKRNADGPAPDGEEYFAMALFFASKKMGEMAMVYSAIAKRHKIS